MRISLFIKCVQVSLVMNIFLYKLLGLEREEKRMPHMQMEDEIEIGRVSF